MPTKALSFSQRRRQQDAEHGRPARAPDHRGSAYARGYDADWRAVRETVLREEPCCTFCPRPATIVDHITPLTAGGARLDRSNLRPVCRECHTHLTANYRKTGRNEMPETR